jgi:hypothetical protein
LSNKSRRIHLSTSNWMNRWYANKPLVLLTFTFTQVDYVFAELEGYAALRDPETGIQVILL